MFRAGQAVDAMLRVMGFFSGWHEREARWKRQAAIDKLGRDGGREELRKAREAAESSDASIRLRGIVALGRFDLDDVEAELIARTRSADDEEDRRIAMMTISRTKDRRFLERLLDGAGDADKSVGSQAFIGLEKIAGPDDIADLLEAADRIESEGRVSSAVRAKRLRDLAARVGRGA